MAAILRQGGALGLRQECGQPTVEAYRLLAATLRAYGMTEPEMRQLMTGSAKEIVKDR